MNLDENLKTRKVGALTVRDCVYYLGDPCYSLSLGCGLVFNNLEQGEWQVEVDEVQMKGEKDARIATFRVLRSGSGELDWLPTCLDISVDSATVGLFASETYPEDNEKRHALAQFWRNNPTGDRVHIFEDGICLPSGFGDGLYPVRTRKRQGAGVVGLEVRLIVQEWLDEWLEDEG